MSYDIPGKSVTIISSSKWCGEEYNGHVNQVNGFFREVTLSFN